MADTKNNQTNTVLFGFYQFLLMFYSPLCWSSPSFKLFDNQKAKETFTGLTDAAKTVFNWLKLAFTTPVLQHFDPLLPSTLITNASNYAIASILLQPHSMQLLCISCFLLLSEVHSCRNQLQNSQQGTSSHHWLFLRHAFLVSTVAQKAVQMFACFGKIELVQNTNMIWGPDFFITKK